MFRNVPLWLSHKQEDALATGVWLFSMTRWSTGFPTVLQNDN